MNGGFVKVRILPADFIEPPDIIIRSFDRCVVQAPNADDSLRDFLPAGVPGESVRLFCCHMFISVCSGKH